MIKKFFISLYLLLISICSFAQIDNPANWKVSLNKIEGNLYEILFSATISGDWHIYDLGPYEDGPIATTVDFNPCKEVNFIGELYLKTPANIKFYEAFNMNVGTCGTGVIIAQKVEALSNSDISLSGVIGWQCCNDSNCLGPEEMEFNIKIPVATTLNATAEDTKGVTDKQIIANNGVNKGGKSLWAIILEAIAWGFVALLTPCVFPMVPMTVSFFLKNSSSNKSRGRFMASLYGLSIIALYTIPIAVIILLTYLLGGGAVTADIFNWLATHWIPNIIFFLIFMVFAASFFGAFEITMPSWIVNKSDSKSDKGGFIGVFFMALTLVLVSFSCTGPIVSSVLIKSTQGEIWEPIVTMFAFSAAFALPFTLFAFAPSLLKDLPKSGGWLNSVKVVLGFIELALGLKFLSVADMVYQWHILDREVYLAIWIVIFSLLGLYLLGKLRFAHDTPQEHISVKRLFLSIIVFSFVVYMIPGMWGAPLKALSGYLPPIESIDFNLSKERGVNVGDLNKEVDNNIYPAKKYTNLGLKHIDGIPGFFDLKEALEYSKRVNKPLFIDFTGAACVNCREMESRVFSAAKVKEILNNDFVFVSVYGDIKKEVDSKDWVTLSNGKVLKSLGKINSHYIMERYNINAMPYYIIVDNQGDEIVEPRGYNLDIELFVKFLEEAKEIYKRGV